jgi:ABC-type transport system involved in multi-copper enzyme maturation permease subunit
VLISTLSYVEGSRIIQDVGLASIRLFTVGIAIFVGVGLIHGEVEKRTIYTILSKPVTRAEFLAGKYVGLVMMVWAQLLIMSLAFVAVSMLMGAPIDGGHIAALALMGMELMVIVGVAIFFSAFTTPMLASLFSVGIYVVGHLTQDLRALGQQADLESVRTTTLWLYYILPDLEMYNLTVHAAHGLTIEAGEIWWPVLYAFSYGAALLIASVYVFQRRDLR